jgi:hypothetical protein
MKTYLSIDPGQDNIGIAWFDEEGQPVDILKFKDRNKFLDWLDEQPVARFIMHETYRNRPGQTQKWNTGGTSKTIGAIERYAHKNKIEVKTYEPSNMYIGLRFLGMGATYKGKHVPDDVSALAGGVWLLQKLGIREHQLKRG